MGHFPYFFHPLPRDAWIPAVGNNPIDKLGNIPLWSVAMSIQSELLTEIESFLAARGDMAETTFGRLAVNDGKLVRRLQDGANMTLATIDRVKAFIQSPENKVNCLRNRQPADVA